MASQRRSDTVVARPYQLELLYAAIDENTIVNLATGAGKTFVAVMLIKQLSHVTVAPLSRGGKRTVFLVNTVPLVQQQAGYIAAHTPLKVGQYYGEMKVDSWSEQRWCLELNEKNVLVMTRAIFKELLHRGYMHLRQVNLIVFDECHHAVKNDDYVQIMKVFDSCSSQEEMPRILGLSASLLPSKCRPGDLERRVTALEETLRCRSQTAADLEEVAKYATNPTQEILSYSSSSNDACVSRLGKLLQGPVTFLESFSRELKVGSYDEVKLYLDDCQHIVENLGVWSAYRFAKEGLGVLNRRLVEGRFYSEWDRSLMQLGWTHLKLFVEASQYLTENASGKTHVSDKVNVLLRYIESRLDADLRGIVFVERRTTAQLLVELLALLSGQPEGGPQRLRCSYIVGHNDGKKGTHLRREAHMSVKKQNEALSKFRSGRINLLVSTSVLEEGVDVPKCNLVVRFNFPQNFRSFIQSKGRARSKISTFLVLIARETFLSVSSQLEEYGVLEKELQRLCHDRHLPEEEAFLARVADLLAAYMPYGVEAGIRATLGSSLSTLHRYCQNLPGDRYTTLAPVFRMEVRRAGELEQPLPLPLDPADTAYRSSVVLPMLCPLHEEIVGPLWMPTQRYARKTAALAAIKRLHETGELDAHLLPVARDESSDEEEEEEVPVARGGSEIDKHCYPNLTAEVLQGCAPVEGSECHLYPLLVTTATGLLYQSQPELDCQPGLGLLTRKPLPHLNIPEFSIYDDVSELSVKVLRYHSTLTGLSQSDLAILRRCHKAIFTQLLPLSSEALEPAVELEAASKGYLVVPLEVFPALHPLEVCVDFELAQRIATLEGQAFAECFDPVRWPCSHEVFHNALVTTLHSPHAKLYSVMCVDTQQNLQSAFPDPTSGYSTFADYFQQKYAVSFSDPSQPALVCRALSDSISRLKLLTSRFKTSQGESLAKGQQRGRTEILFPELCAVCTLPANFWKLTRCLPSILWRVESLLLLEEFRSTVAREIGLRQGRSELTTCSRLRGYEDHGFGSLKTQRITYTAIEHSSDPEVCFMDSVKEAVGLIRGPDNGLLLQALTTTKAMDSVNLERLETLGDSFLKIGTSVFLFCQRNTLQEGKLTSARSRRVGNHNLLQLARHKGTEITGRIFSTNFDPKQTWIPPGFKLKDTLEFDFAKFLLLHSHRVGDKAVADTVEALIGAYLVAGGIEAAIRFMRWMGFKIFSKKEVVGVPSTRRDFSSSSSRSTKPCSSIPLLMEVSSRIFSEYLGPLPAVSPAPPPDQVDRLLQLSTGETEPIAFQKRLGWVFRDRSLLLQALTHASFTSNKITGCYQRLEFLGDAILDYLVTCHVYSTFPKYGPGEITDMRSALVCNVMFAELAVGLGLHKALLHSSPLLFSEIPRFVEAIRASQATDIAASRREGLVAVETAIITETKRLSLSTVAMETEEVEEEEEEEEGEGELDPPKVLGDVLESLAGAVFLDSGMSLEAVWSVFQPLFDQKIKLFEATEVPIPPIHKLYKLAPDTTTKRQKSVLKPGYMLCTLTVPSQGVVVAAEATSYKAAKNAAAKEALKRIKSCI